MTRADALVTRSSRGRIAVIDDDAVFVELMRDLLGAAEGYEVLATSHWLRAFEFISEVQPDLVILDLMLGREQNGWGVLELLRQSPLTATIPVVLCSAAMPALEQCVLALNGLNRNGHGRLVAVSKPFDVDHLLGVIATLLDN
jgi:CheY-like chemotaxis protein